MTTAQQKIYDQLEMPKRWGDAQLPGLLSRRPETNARRFEKAVQELVALNLVKIVEQDAGDFFLERCS